MALSNDYSQPELCTRIANFAASPIDLLGRVMAFGGD